MIVRRRIDLFRLAKHLGPVLAVLLIYDTIITVAFVGFNVKALAVQGLPLSLLGSAIALVVTLRNNVAYSRWWEARSLWGAIVNNSRSIGRGVVSMSDSHSLHEDLIRLQIAYAGSLRRHLLKSDPWEDISPYVSKEVEPVLREARNVPAAIQVAMGRRLAEARRRGEIDSISVATLNTGLNELANAQGGLERIKNTPLPRQYNQLPQIFTSLYCLFLPLGLLHSLGALTPVGSTAIGIMFLALDRVGRDLEDPFAGTIHDVPMQSIVRTIEIDLLQILGVSPIPAPVAEQNGVLT